MEKIDILTNVPVKVAQKCLLYLNSTSVLKIRSVSKSWNDIVEKECFWKNLCQANNIADIARNNETDVSKNFMDRDSISLYHERLWVYKTLLLRNWAMKPFCEILNPDFKNVYKREYFDEEMTVLHRLGRFKIYNAESKLIDRFSWISNLIYGIFRKNNILIIMDGGLHNIMVRDVKSRSNLWMRKFRFLGSGGNMVRVNGDLIYAPVMNSNIISVIGLHSGNIKFHIRVLRGGRVTDIEICNNKLVCISNGYINVFNLENNSLMYTHRFYTNCDTFDYQLSDPYLFTLSCRSYRKLHMAKLHDINDGRTIRKFPVDEYMVFRNSKLIYRHSPKCIKIMDYSNKGNIILEIKTKRLIATVHANDHFVIVGYYTGIAIHDILTGEKKRFISLQELLGIERLITILRLSVTNTKILVEVFHNRAEHRCILNFDVL